MARVHRRTTLLHQWSAKRHEQSQEQIENIRKLKEAAELEECSFAPKIHHGKVNKKKHRTNENNNPSNCVRTQKAQKLLRRRQRNLGHAATTDQSTTSSSNRGNGYVESLQSRTFNDKASHRAIPSMYDEEFYKSARAMYNVGKDKTDASGSSEKGDDDENIDVSQNIGENEEESYEPEYQQPSNGVMENEIAKDETVTTLPENMDMLETVPELQPETVEAAVDEASEDESPLSITIKEHEAILAEEKKMWVGRLKQENTTLVNVLCEVRSAKKQLILEFEHLDAERSKFRTQQLERQESELEETLLRMPLGLAHHDTAGADGAFLHQLVGKMFYKLRANHQVVVNHMLRAATKVERKYLENPGMLEAIEADVALLSEVVHYTDLSRYFEDHWGKPDERVLGRRTVALMAGTSLPPEHQTFPESLTSLPPRPREDDCFEAFGVGGMTDEREESESPVLNEESPEIEEGRLEKEINLLSAKNDALKNNLKQLRQKNKAAKKDRGSIQPTKAVTQMRSDKSTGGSEGTKVGDTEKASNKLKPKRAIWQDVPQGWKQVGWKCLETAVTESIKNQSHDANLSDDVIFEVSEFAMLELVDSVAPLLMVIIRMNKEPWDEANATELCAKIMASPAMMCEIEPIVTMAMTYVKARSEDLALN